MVCILNHLVASLRVEDDSLETGVLVGSQEWGCGVFLPYPPEYWLCLTVRTLF